MKVLAEESWSWMLFEHDGAWFLSVLCGTVGLYSVDFRLSEAEVARIHASGNAAVAELAREVAGQPSSYLARHVPGFSDFPEHHVALQVRCSEGGAA
jgi:hypothetical protein